MFSLLIIFSSSLLSSSFLVFLVPFCLRISFPFISFLLSLAQEVLCARGFECSLASQFACVHDCAIVFPSNRMSDMTDLTEHMPVAPDAE